MASPFLKSERNEAIMAALAAGETKSSQARRYGISVVRVRQIVKREQKRAARGQMDQSAAR
jgi:hypothetical protein